MASTTRVPAHCEGPRGGVEQLTATEGLTDILQARFRTGQAHFDANSITPLKDLGYENVPAGVRPKFGIGDSVIASFDTCGIRKVEDIGWCPVAQHVVYMTVIGTLHYRQQYNIANDKQVAHQLDLRTPAFKIGSHVTWIDEQNNMLYSAVKVVDRHINFKSEHLDEEVPSDHFRYFYTLELANGKRIACTEKKLKSAKETLCQHVVTLIEPTYALGSI